MDSAQHVNQVFSYSQYYLEQLGDTKDRYLDKLKLICCEEDPFFATWRILHRFQNALLSGMNGQM